VQGGRQLWLASAAAAGFPRSLGPHGVVVFPAEIPDPSLARFDYRSPYRHRRVYACDPPPAPPSRRARVPHACSSARLVGAAGRGRLGSWMGRASLAGGSEAVDD
jgi:hypothetical protein